VIGRTLATYRVQSKLGAGGMGEVYRARDEKLDRDVGIKVLPAGLLEGETARSRFRKEAKALSRLSHPHVGDPPRLRERWLPARASADRAGKTYRERRRGGKSPFAPAATVARGRTVTRSASG